MPIHFHCSQCGGEFVAPDQLAGKKARCGRCQTINLVPLETAPVQATLASPAPRPAPQQTSGGLRHPLAGGSAPFASASAPFAQAPLPSDPFAALPADPFAAAAASPLKPLPSSYPQPGSGSGKTLLLVLGGLGAVAVIGLLVICGGFSLLRSRSQPPVMAGPPPVNFQPGPFVNPPPFVPRPPTPFPTPGPIPSPNTTFPPTPSTPLETSVAWSVQPDPPAATAPALKGDLKIPIPVGTTIQLPRQHAPFAAFGTTAAKRTLESHDLVTGQSLGSVQIPDEHVRVTLGRESEFSPDGRHMACRFPNSGDLRINVWTFATGTRQIIDIPGSEQYSSAVRFARPDRVVAVYDDDQQGITLAWFDPATGQKTDEFRDPGVKLSDFDLESVQTSPGGNYVAVVSARSGRVRFWNLDKKAAAGQLSLTFPSGSQPAAAFSPDGSRLGIVNKAGGSYHVAVIDLATGKLATDAHFTAGLSSPQEDSLPPLDWSHDQKYLVYAQQDVLDATTGRKAALLKFSDGYARKGNLRIVGPDQMLQQGSIPRDVVGQLRLASLKSGWLPATDSPLATAPRPAENTSSNPTPVPSPAPRPSDPVVPPATGSFPTSSGTPADGALPTAIAWSARPDPPLSPIEYKKGKISIPLPNSADLRVPEGPSNFVLGYRREGANEAWQVFDLRTGKEIGKPIVGKLELDWRSEAFSPDGRYLAGAMRGGFGDEKKKVGVWSFATGALHQELEIKGNRLSGPIRFAAPHQLITISEPDWNLALLTLWDLSSGQSKLEIPFPTGHGQGDKLRPESLAVSPGGKYAVVVVGKYLGVIDLTTGKPAGRVPLSEEPSACEGISFAPDGTEVAGIFTMGSGHRLVSVDFATGQVRLDHDFRSRLDHYHYEGPVLEWIPGNSGLLYKGHLLLERTSGEEVWIFPTTDGNPRRMIRPGELLVLLRDRKGKALQTAELNTKEINAAMESVRAGGSAVDSVLPPITTPDLFSATAVTLPNGGVSWTYVADASGSTPKGQEKDILISKEGETVRRVLFAGAPAGKIVVQKEITPKAGPGRRPQRQVVIERFDIVTGSKGNTLDVPNVYQLADVSPTGQHALVAFAPEANKVDRLDVLLLSPKKHIAGFRPYAGEKEKPADPAAHRRPWIYGYQTDPRIVTWAALIDDEHVLTVNSAGKLVCWKLPECKAVYYFEDFGMPLALSAGRQVLLGVHNGEYRLFRAKTGECLGDLEAPTLGSLAVRAGFRQDGGELSAIIDAGPDRMFVRWDLATGKRKDEFPVPSALAPAWFAFHYSHNGMRQGIEYRGKDYVMVDDHYLVHLPNQATVWKYHLGGGFYANNSPDHLSWYCVRRQGATDNSQFLTSWETPSLNTKGKAANMTLKRQLVLSPGDAVKVLIDLGGVGMSDLTPTIEKSVVQALELRGMKIDPGAGYQFSLVAAERSTGKEIGIFEDRSPFGFSPFFHRGGGTPDQVIQQQEMVVRFAVSNASGKVLWHQDRASPMRNYGSVNQGDAQQQLREEMTRNFQGLLASSGSATQSLPRYLFADLDKCLAGESQLGFRTEEPPPTVTLPQNQQPQQPAEITIRP